MKNRLVSAIGIVAALALVLVAVWAVIWGVLKQPAVVGSFATAAGAIIAVVLQRERENRREVVQRHREQLAPLYESLFKRFGRGGFDPENPDDREFIYELQRKLIFYGSTPV